MARPPDLELDDQGVAEAVQEARRRNGSSTQHVVYDPGEAMSEEQHIRATVSELAISKLYGLEWTAKGQQGLERADVGDVYEVRAIGNEAHGLVLRDRDRRDLPFILAYTVQRRVWLVGWAWAHDVKVDAYRQAGSPKSPTPFWLRPGRTLAPMGGLPSPAAVKSFEPPPPGLEHKEPPLFHTPSDGQADGRTPRRGLPTCVRCHNELTRQERPTNPKDAALCDNCAREAIAR